LGYSTLHGPEIAAGQQATERDDSGYHDVILKRRLWQLFEWFNLFSPYTSLREGPRMLMSVNFSCAALSEDGV
jgi:hypothetical protein